MRVGLQKTSLVNYPGHVAAVVFLPGCNMRCPYCYNAELACASGLTGPEDSTANRYVSLEAVYEHLSKRKNVLTGCVITGGEALLSPALSDLIVHAKEAGLAVKIDTNGLLPDALSQLVQNPKFCPDMLALDIKTSPARYGELIPQSTAAVQKNAETAITKTLIMLQNRRSFCRTVAVEYRTVLVPGLVTEADICSMAAYVPADAVWFFSPFMPGSCLDPQWNLLSPYTLSEMQALVRKAQQFVPLSSLRK